MKRYILLVMMTILCLPATFAQSSLYKSEGKCGEDAKWVFDGYTLTITNTNKKGLVTSIDDYDMKHHKSPWNNRITIRKVVIEPGIKRIGSCAFVGCTNIQEVVFKGFDMQEIGWAAFYNCPKLRTISLPARLRIIETVAFANCISLTSVSIPDQCRVGDMAFASCTNIKSLELSPNAILGRHVFSTEVKKDNQTAYVLYSGEIRRLPSYINPDNCQEFGLSRQVVEKIKSNNVANVNYDYITSEVDSLIPYGSYSRPNTYALIIGNQNYRFASDVPYAIHDARVFAEYCSKTLGIPAGNIHIAEDATKQMILEEELGDWISTIPNREDKRLIVYYTGHGVPDIKNNNKAYLLPSDVRGTSAHHGIALDDLYRQLGDLAFNRVSVFLDACFSGVNRENEGVADGLRAVEIEAEETTFGEGNVVVFSAAQGNETAQGFPEEGHGLFTYYLLKELRWSLGDTTYGELADRIKDNVSQQAKQLKMRKKQTPSINSSESIAETWRNLNF